MARINIKNFSKITKERINVHESVDSTYTIFSIANEKYLQIDTYGRKGRKVEGKISQSLQLDKDSAMYLVKLITKEFDL